MARIRTAAAALTLLAASCTLEGPGGAGTISVDISTPESIDWRRTVSGFEVAGSGTQPDPTELATLAAALSEIPQGLVNRAAVRTIYRVVAADDQLGEEALAFATGPDIYLTDGTFARASGRFDLAEVLAHEMTHTAQFAALTDDDLSRIQSLEGPGVYSVTEFVIDFAESVGWRNTGTTDAPQWALSDPTGTTVYGATEPSEDMADTVARVAMGRSGGFSAERVSWSEDFVGVRTRGLEDGKPFVPDGSVEISPDTPLFDEDTAERLSPDRVEPRSWSLPAAVEKAELLARQITDELGRRGFAGRLRLTEDPAIARYTGEFLRGDGLRFLVELWDFREAPGFASPRPVPVLTYVALW